jgi:hypothetical protein
MEQISIQDALQHAGRADVATRYYKGRHARSAVKQEQRQKVADFILAHLSPSPEQYVYCLSMPGEGWAFENILMAAHPRCQFVGIERSATVFANSRRAIPRGRLDRANDFTGLEDREITYGRARISYSRVTASRRTKITKGGKVKHEGRLLSRSNRLLLCDMSAYLTMLVTDYGATMDEKKQFHAKFCKRNAAWLDFCGPLCASTEEAISSMHFALSTSQRVIPVAITLMNCRDAYRSAEQRVARITKIQPGFRPVEHWTYVGGGGVSMLTVCGVFENWPAQTE